MVKKIVILGPESTGKSTISAQLAGHYQTEWVPEYAREHLTMYGTSYTYDDLLTIAKKQLELEDAYTPKARNGLLFIDTNMYVMKVWCEFVYGRCHQWILDRIVERSYDMYLLTNTDLPWAKDELREYPDLDSRLRLFHIYKDNLVHQHVPWKEIAGTEMERLNTAVTAVNDFLRTKKPSHTACV